ncbi:hypothetical protein ACFLV7_06575 [Chloroflexota bacterium]
MVYNKETKALVYNDIKRVDPSSYDLPNMKLSDDGCVYINFGPESPAAMESN